MAEDEEARYEQALRFLASLQSQRHQDIDSQRSFLQSKGLSEELIARAFKDVKRPDSIAAEGEAAATVAGEGAASASSVDDSEAFERAAKTFDDPLEKDGEAPITPPKTYPKSPLALYQAPQAQQPFQMQSNLATNPITRYDVLLSFFRSACYLLVLGGGVTGILVAIYRTYLLPRMITSLDCRSVLLKHHLDQYSILTNKVKNLRGNSLAPTSQRDSASTSASLKGVLKKVQFADEIAKEKRAVEEEEKKEAGEKVPATERDEEKQNLLEDNEEEVAEGEEKGDAVVEPVDVLGPIRSSLSRLNQALRADASASAIGTQVIPTTTTTETSRTSSSSAKASTATTVEEESDADSWVSEEDSDELEFDPYSSSSPKRKHDPSITTKPSSSTSNSTSSSTSSTSLNSSLSTLNAFINSQTYMASSHAFGGRMLGMGGPASSADKANSSKAGDVAQIRADIRNLKGLLLSRRNFPTYRTSPAVTSTATPTNQTPV